MTNFPNGLPIKDLAPHLQPIASELDKQRMPSRGTDARDDKRIGPSEIAWGLQNLSAFEGTDEAARIGELAQLFGLSAAPAKKVWADRTANDNLRDPMATASFGDKIYVADERIRGISVYDAASDTWSSIATPFDRAEFNDGSLAAGNGRLFVSGGRLGGSMGDPSPWLWVRSTEGGDWGHVQTGVKRTDAAAVEAGGTLYLFGGVGGARTSDSKATRSSQKYDPASGAVTSLPELPEARYGARAIELDGKLYVVGGRDADATISNRVDVFDLQTQTWAPDPIRLNNAVFHPSLWIEDGKLHVAGGKTSGNMNNWTSNADLQVIDPKAGKVTNGATLPNGQYDSTVFAKAADRLFMFGSDPDYHRNAGSAHTRELTLEAPPAAPTFTPTTVINANIDITNVNVTNRITVNHVENHETNVIHVAIDNRSVDIDLLPFSRVGKLVGFFGDDFFLRTQSGSNNLLAIESGDEGPRALVGRKADQKSPARANAKLQLFIPDHGVIPFSTDANGQFRVELPEGAKGRAYIFPRGDEPSAAAAIELPG